MKSKVIWFVLLLFLVFALWMVSGARGQPRGAEALKAGARQSYTLAAITPATMMMPAPSNTMTLTLRWDPSPGTNVIVNYLLYWGTESHTYTNRVSCGTNLGKELVLPRTRPYYFSVTAVDENGLDSDFSNEAVLPIRSTNYVVTISCSLSNWPPYVVTNPSTTYFYRMAATKQGSKWRVRGQRSPGVKGTWSDWSYWPAFTNNSVPANVRMFVRKEMK